jgi:hypothetical protein
VTLFAQQLSSNDLSESYGAGASDGLYDGVDLAAHGATPAASSSDANVSVLRAAWFLVVLSLAALWLLGAGPFRSARA